VHPVPFVVRVTLARSYPGWVLVFSRVVRVSGVTEQAWMQTRHPATLTHFLGYGPLGLPPVATLGAGGNSRAVSWGSASVSAPASLWMDGPSRCRLVPI
jgi:hypothetical protein